MPVNNLESIINRSLGLVAGKGADKSAGLSADAGQTQADTSSRTEPATKVTLSSSALPRKIVNSYEKVELSSRVPQQIPVETMTQSQEIADTMLNGGKLNRGEYKELRENRVLAALTGMRIIQAQTGEVEKVWLSGIPKPNAAELDEAYRRLTQRLSNPKNTEELMQQNAERVNLLEAFRSRDFSAQSASANSASADSANANTEEAASALAA